MIKNLAPVCKVKQYYRNKEKLAPQRPFKMIISGKSGCGKTNLLLNFIIYYVDWDKLYVYAKHIDEDFYTYLQELMNEVKENILMILKMILRNLILH